MRELVERVVEDERRTELDLTVGTMIELPRACFIADRIAAVADFFSFGTNDLTQTALGFSRDDVEGKFLAKYLEEKIVDRSPFETIDKPGVGLARAAGRVGRARAQARPEARHLRRARRRPGLDRLLPHGRARLRELLAVPRADRARRGGAGGDRPRADPRDFWGAERVSPGMRALSSLTALLFLLTSSPPRRGGRLDQPVRLARGAARSRRGNDLHALEFQGSDRLRAPATSGRCCATNDGGTHLGRPCAPGRSIDFRADRRDRRRLRRGRVASARRAAPTTAARPSARLAVHLERAPAARAALRGTVVPDRGRRAICCLSRRQPCLRTSDGGPQLLAAEAVPGGGAHSSLR